MQLPANEVQFVPTVPVRVAEVFAQPGQRADEAVMAVAEEVVTIDSSVPVEEAQLIQAGMAVTIDEPDLGVEATGMVGRVAANPGTDGVDGFHVYVEVIVDGLPPNVVNASVRLTIPVESTGEAVLAVPVAALTLAADGSSQVQRSVDGVLEAVAVTPGLAAQGYVEIGTDGDQLTEGDMVLVGFEQQ